MKQTHIRILFQSICLLMLSGALAAHAQNIFKAATTTMSASTDWSATDGGTPGVAPSASTVGEFGVTPTAGNLSGMTLGASMSLLGLQLDATMAGPLTIATGNTLTLGASGITASYNSTTLNNATLGCALTLSSPQSWNIASGQTLTASGAVTFTGGLTINGTGTVTLSAANTGAGGLTINGGSSATLGTITSAGTGTITINGTMTFPSTFTGGTFPEHDHWKWHMECERDIRLYYFYSGCIQFGRIHRHRQGQRFSAVCILPFFHQHRKHGSHL